MGIRYRCRRVRCGTASHGVTQDGTARQSLGYPTAEDEELRDYAEDKRDLCGTVYGFVPVKLVDEVLTKHGGIVGADFSNDEAGFWEDETNDND